MRFKQKGHCKSDCHAGCLVAVRSICIVDCSVEKQGSCQEDRHCRERKKKETEVACPSSPMLVHVPQEADKGGDRNSGQSSDEDILRGVASQIHSGEEAERKEDDA